MATTTTQRAGGSTPGSDSGSGGGSSLQARLAAVLPQHARLRVHHVSTPPSKSAALCSPPPNERPDRTFCERHFLAVSVDVPPPAASPPTAAAAPPAKQVLVLGLEVFVYTTAHATTVFVSKADSTGFLGLVRRPDAGPSPVRDVCAAFLAHLVDTRRRSGVQCVVSLFARAQDQYLFPGSVKHRGKHVLDDRGLVKWWCRVLDPLLVSPPCKRVQGYLLVPGLDPHETRAFVPRASPTASSWSLGHPLERISHYCREFDWVPPRCLIPCYPDDPKSRFRDELDDEAAGSGAMQTTGSWKSVKTLDLFWDMMAFRQECSSGRLTGFIWVVFEDGDDDQLLSKTASSPVTSDPQTPKKQKTAPALIPNTTPKRLFPAKTASNQAPNNNSRQQEKKRPKTRTRTRRKRKLRGIIIPRQPRIKTKPRNHMLNRPTSSKYYHWPPQGRGERLVDESDYKRIVDLLLHLDFATLDKATGSTRRWITEAGMGRPWGYEVTGTRRPPPLAPSGEACNKTAQVNNLSGLVKRKRAETTGQAGSSIDKDEPGTSPRDNMPKVNVLGAGQVRKRPRAQDV